MAVSERLRVVGDDSLLIEPHWPRFAGYIAADGDPTVLCSCLPGEGVFFFICRICSNLQASD